MKLKYRILEVAMLAVIFLILRAAAPTVGHEFNENFTTLYGYLKHPGETIFYSYQGFIGGCIAAMAATATVWAVLHQVNTEDRYRRAERWEKFASVSQVFESEVHRFFSEHYWFITDQTAAKLEASDEDAEMFIKERFMHSIPVPEIFSDHGWISRCSVQDAKMISEIASLMNDCKLIHDDFSSCCYAKQDKNGDFLGTYARCYDFLNAQDCIEDSWKLCRRLCLSLTHNQPT